MRYIVCPAECILYIAIYFVLPSDCDIYDLPINLQYIYKRVSPLLVTLKTLPLAPAPPTVDLRGALTYPLFTADFLQIASSVRCIDIFYSQMASSLKLTSALLNLSLKPPSYSSTFCWQALPSLRCVMFTVKKPISILPSSSTLSSSTTSVCKLSQVSDAYIYTLKNIVLLPREPQAPKC